MQAGIVSDKTQSVISQESFPSQTCTSAAAYLEKNASAKPEAPIPAVTPAQLASGMFWGALGVLMFSGGIPATRLAVAELPVLFVGAGRALVAAVLSVLLLLLLKQKVPAKQHWPALAIVAFGAVFAYPIFSAIAMQTVEASHGTLISSIMPLFTALFGAWLSKIWPRPGFWLCAIIGTGAVMVYSATSMNLNAQSSDVKELSHSYFWGIASGDWWLVLACFCCGLSYAQGALVARHIGSWQVICWALVLSLPLLIPLCWFVQPAHYDVSLSSWLGFGYLAVFSMFLGFFAWYKGLSTGGVAQVSQLQLLTPFLAFCWAALWLGENISLSQWLMAIVVVVSIALGRKLA